jgi:hypothetical protein
MTGLGVPTPTNSIPSGVNVCEPKRSASDSADNLVAAKCQEPSTTAPVSGDDDNFTPVSTPIALIQFTGTSQHRMLFDPGQLASFNSSSSSNPELGDFEHTASDSADNPSTPTDRFASDERHGEHIECGECDGGGGDSSEVAGRVSVFSWEGSPRAATQ